MQFLIACDTLPGGTFDRDKIPAIKEALAGKEYEMIDLFSFAHENPHTIRTGDIKGFFANADLKELNERFLKLMTFYSPKILVLCTLDLVSLFLFPETLRELRQKMKVVCFFGDDEYMLNRHAHWVDRFDKNVAYVKWCADYYNNIVPGSTYYLPHGCYFYERDFDKLQDEKEYDVIFIGNPFGERIEIAKKIQRIGDGLGIKTKVFGNEEWKKYPVDYGGFLGADTINAQIRKSRIVVSGSADHITGKPHLSGTPFVVIKNGSLPMCTPYPPFINDYGLNIPSFSLGFLETIIKIFFCRPISTASRARELFEKTKKDFDFVNLFGELFGKLEKEFAL